jgi:hypothetical protein
MANRRRDLGPLRRDTLTPLPRDALKIIAKFDGTIVMHLVSTLNRSDTGELINEFRIESYEEAIQKNFFAYCQETMMNKLTILFEPDSWSFNEPKSMIALKHLVVALNAAPRLENVALYFSDRELDWRVANRFAYLCLAVNIRELRLDLPGCSLKHQGAYWIRILKKSKRLVTLNINLADNGMFAPA